MSTPIRQSIRLAVLSDVHAYDSSITKDGNSPSHFDIAGTRNRESCPLTALLEKIESDSIKADLLVCPGDFCDKACKKSLIEAWSITQEVARKLEAKHVIATVGNHDVDSRHTYHSYDPIKELKTLSPSFPVNDTGLSTQYWAWHFHLFSFSGLTLLNVNSSAYHTAGKPELEHGRIDEETLNQIKQQLKEVSIEELKILLCHHNPQKHSEIQLGEGDEILGGQMLLDTLADETGCEWLVIHGHKHHPKVTYASGASFSPIVFSAGSVASTLYPKLQRETGNQFYVIEIPLKAISQNGLRGRFQSWDWHQGFGWRAADSSKGLPAEGGFGHRESPARFASRIAKWLKRRCKTQLDSKELAKDLVGKFPEFQYILPQDVVAVDACLKQSGFSLVLEETGRLSQVVKYVNP